MRKVFGRYVVADTQICHGKLTFRGTRILVADVLDQLAMGLAWETIVEEWDGKISVEAIAEVIRLASEALLTFKDQLVEDSDPEGRTDSTLDRVHDLIRG